MYSPVAASVGIDISQTPITSTITRRAALLPVCVSRSLILETQSIRSRLITALSTYFSKSCTIKSNLYLSQTCMTRSEMLKISLWCLHWRRADRWCCPTNLNAWLHFSRGNTGSYPLFFSYQSTAVCANASLLPPSLSPPPDSGNTNRRWRPSVGPTGFHGPHKALQPRGSKSRQAAVVNPSLHRASTSALARPNEVWWCINHLAQCVAIDRQRSSFKQGCGSSTVITGRGMVSNGVSRQCYKLRLRLIYRLPPLICLPYWHIDWLNLVGVLRLLV